MDKKLHIVRVRGRGDGTFYDPQADFRGILPNIAVLTLGELEDSTEDQEAKQAYKHLYHSFRIFQLRLLEDSTPLNEQLKLFHTAVSTVPLKYRETWRAAFMEVLLSLYALLMRRDQPMRGRDFKDLVNAAGMLSLQKRLSPEHYRQVCSWLGEEGVDSTFPVSQESTAICEETGDKFTRLRDIAARLVNADGAETWEEMADLCDKQFNADGLADVENIALALAYPTYRHPTMRVEVEEEDGR
jgi:hypothetical protein